MTRQRKQAPEAIPARGATGSEREIVPESAVGNAALQDRLAGGDVADLGRVREVASPLVERAVLALQLVPRGSEQVQRFVDILARSHLPDERKELLSDRLRTDEAIALGVHEAIERWFSADTPEFRGALVEALDRVGSALQHGSGDTAAGKWRDDVRDVPLSGGVLTGAMAGRAEALIADLAIGLIEGPVAEGAKGGVGAAVRGFCSDVLLALVWDEEEEEEEWEAAPAVEEW
jgi:hypothetical protein